MLRLILLISIFACAVAPGPGGTHMCPVCSRVKDPASCRLAMRCGHGQDTCYVRVEYLNGEFLYSKGCTHDCVKQDPRDINLIIGKREPHHEHVHNQVCQECCTTGRNGNIPECNPTTCAGYLTTTAKPTTTTTTTTSAPTTTPVPARACMDHEGDGFLCSDYDSYNFCTDTNSLAHKLAVDRCPQHCGMCDDNGNFRVTPAPTMAQTTPAPAMAQTTPAPTMKQSTPSPTMAQSTQAPAMAQTTAAPAMTTTGIQLVNINVTSCADKEDQGFSCQQWASYGFCSDGTGTGHAIAVERCSKYCGFCS